MKLTIKYFGLLAEALEKRLEEIDCPNNTTKNELQKLLIERYPIIKTKQFSIAINQQITKEDLVLNEQDEIALLPPFAGG